MSSKSTAPQGAIRPFGWMDKLGYAMGDMGCGFSFQLVSTFMQLFYLQYIGLSPADYAIIILISKAFEFDANIALFGHTHMTCKNNYSGLELLNPGSIGQGDYGIVLLGDGKIETYLKNINDLSC